MNSSNSASLLVMETTASPTTVQRPRPLLGTITSLASLREHLQWAIELEHATIPPYLCALYSIKPGHNAQAREVLSSVMVEEMLHLTLAANLLNAVGGRPELDIPGMLPRYPQPLPHGDPAFQISLFRFGPKAIEGASAVQVWDGDSDVFHPEREEVAHYYRFQELKLGRRYRRGDTPWSGPTGDPISIDWTAIWPMRTNPRTSGSPEGSPIRIAQEEFNRSYCGLLQLLEQAFNGAPQMLGASIGTMYTIKTLAQALMQMPTEDGLETAGPTFEYIASDRRAVGPEVHR